MKEIEKKYLVIGVAAILSTIALRYLSKKSKKQKRYLSISVGGTNSKICILQKSQFLKTPTIIGQISEIETKTPEEFMNFVKTTFKPEDFDEIAIASFGPLCLNQTEKYGQLLCAPSEQKRAWKDFSLARSLGNYFKKPSSVETDVNAAAQAEFHLGNHNVSNSLAYITIGTGVGVGLVINNKTVHGYLHPEGGHTTFFKKCKLVRRRSINRFKLSLAFILRGGLLKRDVVI